MVSRGRGSRQLQLTSRVPSNWRRFARNRGQSPKACCVSVRQDQNCCNRRSGRNRTGPKDAFGKKADAPKKAEPAAAKPAQPKELTGVRKAGAVYGPADGK